MKLIHVFTVFTTPESFFDGQFKYLKDKGYEIVLVSSNHPEANAFAERNGIRFESIEIPRSLSVKRILFAITSLIRLIRKEHPDAVFGHTPVGALCAMIASKLCGVKNRIYYRHGLIYTTMKGLRKRIFRMEERLVATLATKVVNVSHSLSSLAVKEHLNNDSKQFVIGAGTCGGIDAGNLFNPKLLNNDYRGNIKKQLGLESADLVMGFCGRICNDKGISELVQGFELFQTKHRELKCKLILLGKIDTRDGINEEIVSQIENNRDIIISGVIHKYVIPYYYSLLDVFVFPSYREGFGMCVVEASAMEKPILVSKSHGCIDSIIENKTGIYIEISPDGVCEGMEKMIDRGYRQELGQFGRKHVLKNFDYPVMWPLVAELYGKILE